VERGFRSQRPDAVLVKGVGGAAWLHGPDGKHKQGQTRFRVLDTHLTCNNMDISIRPLSLHRCLGCVVLEGDIGVSFFLSFFFPYTSCSEVVNGQPLDYLRNCPPCFGDEDRLCEEGDTQTSCLGGRYQIDKLKTHFHSGTECLQYLLIVCCALGYGIMFPAISKHLQCCPALIRFPMRDS